MENNESGFVSVLREVLQEPETEKLLEPIIITSLRKAGFTVRPRPENLN